MHTIIYCLDGSLEYTYGCYSCAQTIELIVTNQLLHTSASMQHPLNAWLNYDMQFRITAASDPTICWNVRHTDLWLKWITPFLKQAKSE